jgi:hypothetical protein
MSMKKKLLIISAGLFAFFFVLELWLEHLGKVDSIGIWYTAYCAFINTIPATVVAAIILKWQRRNG